MIDGAILRLKVRCRTRVWVFLVAAGVSFPRGRVAANVAYGASRRTYLGHSSL